MDTTTQNPKIDFEEIREKYQERYGEPLPEYFKGYLGGLFRHGIIDIGQIATKMHDERLPSLAI